MDKLRALITLSSDVSRLDKMVMTSFCDNITNAYQQGILKKVSDRETLVDSEMRIILDCIAGMSAMESLLATQTSDGESGYIVKHFTDSFANLFMEHELVTKKDINNFDDNLTTHNEFIQYVFDNPQIPPMSQPIDAFKANLSNEICSRYLKKPAAPDAAWDVADKLSNLDKEHLINFFCDVDLYDCCILTVLRESSDQQLKNLYIRFYD
jgi:hypothetical protein